MPQFDYTKADAMAMPVEQVEPDRFDFDRFEAFAAEADRRYAEFLARPSGVAVWQRVRVGEVFRDACRDMKLSLRLQLGGLTRAMDYLTDAPPYLEPWYGIGTTAGAFGAEYEWPPGQAPVVKPLWRTLDELPELVARPLEDAPILRYTLDTIEYFIEQTRRRVPISWCDIQSPINAVGGLVEITEFFMAMRQEPDRAKTVLSALADEIIRFTKVQTELIGPALARPGHGFASARTGVGIGLSTDNLIMISPAMYAEFCAEHTARIGSHFGGVAIHCCGNWGRWLEAVKQIPNLIMVDGAFSPQTDPDPCNCEQFRDALAGTGIILQARI
ncbi:MAG: uroporphyrinogen decarboxylase family protein, partial [Verrucomicrobiae bacterium]|nr:uroporphyrinogen decarboxylase family protein [Verrucomicrobiae bacterium]